MEPKERRQLTDADLLCEQCVVLGDPVVAGDLVLGTHCPKCGKTRYFPDGTRAKIQHEPELRLEMMHRTDREGEHNSSLEAGPANCRFKLYFNEGQTSEERRAAMKSALQDMHYALSEAKVLGLIADPAPTRKRTTGEEERP